MSGVEQQEPEEPLASLESLERPERREAAKAHWDRYCDPEWRGLLDAETIQPGETPPIDTGS